MNLETLQEKGKQVIDQITHAAQQKGKQVISKVANTTQEKASDLTEETIITAVDQAINAIQIAGQRFKEREIPAEKVSLEVSVSIGGLVELRMRADVPNTGEIKEVIVDVTETTK